MTMTATERQHIQVAIQAYDADSRAAALAGHTSGVQLAAMREVMRLDSWSAASDVHLRSIILDAQAVVEYAPSAMTYAFSRVRERAKQELALRR